MAGVRLHPQRDARHHDQRPRRPEHVAARRERERQCQRRPQREELPWIGAGLVGLAEVGEERADAEQREQRRAARAPSAGPARRAHIATTKACSSAKRPKRPSVSQLAAIQKTTPSPAERGGQHRDAARQDARQAGRRIIETREVLQLPQAARIEPLLVR